MVVILLQRLLLFLNLRIRAVLRGSGFSDKVKLVFIIVLDSVSRVFLRKSPRLVRGIKCVKKLLSRNTVVNYMNCKLYVDPDLVTLFENSEEFMWECFAKYLGECSVFVDIGAHIGKYAVPVAKALGECGLVVAIEPHPDNYGLLLRNIDLNKLRNVVALRIAAWSSEEELTLFTGEYSTRHSVKKNHGLGSIVVKAKPLDNVLEEIGVNRVDLIKIDVEGAEVEVLKGMSETMKRHHPVIVVEVWSENSKLVEEIVSQFGYRVERINREYYLLY